MESESSLQPELFNANSDGEVTEVGGVEVEKEVKEPTEEEKLDKFIEENINKYPPRIFPLTRDVLREACTDWRKANGKIETEEDEKKIIELSSKEYAKKHHVSGSYDIGEIEKRFEQDFYKWKAYREEMREKLKDSQNITTVAPAQEKQENKTDTEPAPEQPKQPEQKEEYLGWMREWENSKD